MPTTSGARAAFQNSNFRYYLGARFLAAIATEMQALAVAWQIYGLTHRPLDLGLVGLAQFLPGIFLFCWPDIRPIVCRGSASCKHVRWRFPSAPYCCSPSPYAG
jgi:hypothetical protein